MSFVVRILFSAADAQALATAAGRKSPHNWTYKIDLI